MSDRVLLCKLASEWRRMIPSERQRLPRTIEGLLEEAHRQTVGDIQRCICLDGKRSGVHGYQCPAR